VTVPNPLPGRPRSRRPGAPSRRRAALLAAGLSTLLVAAPVPALASTPSPAPSAPTSGSTAASPSADPSPAPDSTSPAPTPSASGPSASEPAGSPSPSSSTSPSSSPGGPSSPDGAGADQPERAAARARSLTLSVASSGSPVAGRFYQDIGRFVFSGAAAGIAEDSRVEVYRRTAGATAWRRVASTSVTGSGTFRVTLPVQARGAATFAATTGGAPGSGDEVASPRVAVTVRDATVSLSGPVRVDSLKSASLKGSVVPARAGVVVHVDVRRGSDYHSSATATTRADGRFTVAVAHGKGHLASYRVRSSYHASNRDRWETSDSTVLRRVAVLAAVVTDTAADEVRHTYRKGCPVGRSKLSTIRMNYYGRDKLMHRGVLIVRRDLVGEIKAAFGKSLTARYPFTKMRNPDVYDGNDPRQMKADNTSGFNCRKVVGNPYAQSPHSYGIAIDVNTVRNPYRDSRGKWWPANGKPYIDRTPLRRGMLGKSSTLTEQLRSDKFFWGGLWSPGRDYQHFEYRP